MYIIVGIIVGAIVLAIIVGCCIWRCIDIDDHTAAAAAAHLIIDDTHVDHNVNGDESVPEHAPPVNDHIGSQNHVHVATTNAISTTTVGGHATPTPISTIDDSKHLQSLIDGHAHARSDGLHHRTTATSLPAAATN
jgi:hypothetical protein